MKSKGGKIEYFCTNCGSPDIFKDKAHGQDSFSCRICHYYAPWRTRGKKRASTGIIINTTFTENYPETDARNLLKIMEDFKKNFGPPPKRQYIKAGFLIYNNINNLPGIMRSPKDLINGSNRTLFGLRVELDLSLEADKWELKDID